MDTSYVTFDDSTPSRPFPLWFRLTVVIPCYSLLVALGLIAVRGIFPFLGLSGDALLVIGMVGILLGVGAMLARCGFEVIRAVWRRGRSRKVGAGESLLV